MVWSCTEESNQCIDEKEEVHSSQEGKKKRTPKLTLVEVVKNDKGN